MIPGCILQEEDAEQLPQKVPTVPVDDSQQECALSGEKFDTIWDLESEDWHYLGAVRLDAQQAARCRLPCSVYPQRSHTSGRLRLATFQAGGSASFSTPQHLPTDYTISS